MKPLIAAVIAYTTTMLIACASQAPQTAAGGNNGGGNIGNANGVGVQTGQNPGAQASDQPAATGCSNTSTPSASGVVTEGPQVLNGNAIHVYANRAEQQLTLCQVLQKTGKSVMVLQFAGVTCFDCTKDSQLLRAQIAASGYGAEIAHVVVLTDKFSDFQDNEATRFMTNNAAGDIAVFDEGSLWQYYNANPTLPDRSLTIAFSKSMQSVVYNHKGSVNDIVSAAAGLAKNFNQTTSTTGGRTP